jgi:hypothetical protein
VDEDVLGARVLDVQQRDADDRVRFVEGAIGRYADVEFRQARSVAKRRVPVITGAGVDSIDSQWEVFRRGRADCPIPPREPARAIDALNGSPPSAPSRKAPELIPCSCAKNSLFPRKKAPVPAKKFPVRIRAQPLVRTLVSPYEGAPSAQATAGSSEFIARL